MFGVAVFISKVALPSPVDKMAIGFQALFLALGSLLMGLPGATFVAFIGGILTAFWRAPMAPFTLFFAMVYGLLVDGFILILKVRNSNGDVRPSRMIASLAASTGIVGLASYYTTTLVGIIPHNPFLDVTILVTGVINGVVAGYVATYVWKRNLRQLMTQ